MPKSKFAGKTKEDLVQIAVVSDLLTPSQARRLTKARLLSFLLDADSVVASGEDIKLWLKAQISPKGAYPDIPPRRPPGRPRITAKSQTRQLKPESLKGQLDKAKNLVRSSSQDQTDHSDKSKSEQTADVSKSKDAQKQADSPKQAEAPKQADPGPVSKQEVGRQAGAGDGGLKVESEPSPNKQKIKAHDLLRREKDKVKKADSNPLTKRDNVSKAKLNRSDSDSTKDDNTYSQGQEEGQSNDQAKPNKTNEQKLVTGILEMMPDGYGFLRLQNYLQGPNDVYVPPQYIRRFKLRPGDEITGPVRSQRDNDRYEALYYIKSVNGRTPDKMVRRPRFDSLTPIYPNERLKLESGSKELSTRIIDLISPVGKGQRGMIVSPPKAGKTILLQKIANSIKVHNPEAKLIVLLIDERPEEVTDMQRSIDGEVVYSTFDKTPENHIKVTELVLERAMRLVELGDDVVILLDSITRMARAYNLTVTPSGRTLSGGVDPAALYGPKRFFGAARNIEHGGSLTILATALVDTGSRMDELIFEEFKGTGNMEVVLDRKIAEKRIFPAIDVLRSSTRREELLLEPDELEAVWAIRRAFSSMDPPAVAETLLNLMRKTRDNLHFADTVNKSFTDQSVFDKLRSDAHANGKANNGRDRFQR